MELLGSRMEALFHPVVLCFHPTLDLGPIFAQMDIRVHRPPCFPMYVLSFRDTWATSMRITTEMERNRRDSHHLLEVIARNTTQQRNELVSLNDFIWLHPPVFS